LTIDKTFAIGVKWIEMRGFSRGRNWPYSQRLICIFIILGILAISGSAVAGRFLASSDDGQDYGYVPLAMSPEPQTSPWQGGNPENSEMAAGDPLMAVFSDAQWLFIPSILRAFVQVSDFVAVVKIGHGQACQLLDLPPPVAQSI
jgi:hypothetical protein